MIHTPCLRKNHKALAREKLHIDKDIKKWVYVLDSNEFKKKLNMTDIDFGQESDAPY